MRTWVVSGAIGLVGLLLLIVLGGVGLLYWQARQTPVGRPDYVALGSSFAAGIGLGAGAPGSPLICMRSVNGYPQQLSRLRGLSLVDVTCSGATSTHVLKGGQVFLGPQIDAVGRNTRLVTMTIGGNDISYVGDLSFLAARQQASLSGRVLRLVKSAPEIDRARDYDGVRASIVAVIRTVRQRAPHADIVVISYPQILPPQGTCDKLGLTAAQVAAMRTVGDKLLVATREAAREGGAHFVDAQELGAEHHACSPEPWVNGWNGAEGTQFHPTLAGATQMAQAISALLDQQR